MKGKHVFVDTSILVYAHDLDSGAKHEKAASLVRSLWEQSYPAAISVQVLQEFYVTLTKKGVAVDKAQEMVSSYLSWEIIENDKSLLTKAFEIHRTKKVSFWDSMIIAAAQKARSTILFTEDLAHGEKFDTVRIESPFQ